MKIVTASIIFFLIGMINVFAQGYLNFPIDTIVSDEYYNYRALMKYDNFGKVHMVNSRQFHTNSNTREIFYWNNLSGEMTPYRVTNNSIDDNYATLGFDELGKVHIGWERRDASNLFQLIYTNNRNVSSGFGDSVWITAGGLNKATPYMAVGLNDSSVHFVYFTFVTGQDNAYYKKYNYINGILGQEISLGPAEASSENDISIAVDGLGKLHIVFTTNQSAGSGVLKYFNNENGNFVEQSTGVSNFVSYPCITIDKLNTLHVVYRNAIDNRLYTIRRQSGGIFSSAEAITPPVGMPSFYRAIDTDDNGKLFVTYQNSNSAFPKGTFLVYGSNGNYVLPILLFEDSTGSYIGRGNNSVAARGFAQIAVHFEATASRNGSVVSDIFMKEGNLSVMGINYTNEFKDDGFEIYGNFPNPFNPNTSIRYFIPYNGNVQIKVFDILGNVIGHPINEFKTAGMHSFEFNADNLSSGVYFYSVRFGKFSETKKMLLLK